MTGSYKDHSGPMSSVPVNEKEESDTTGSRVGTDSDNEKYEQHKMDEGATGDPDSDHEEVEHMDAGHMRDLELQHVCIRYTSV